MPELDVQNGGDLAQLLKDNGYSLNGESKNLEMLGKLPKAVKARVSALKAIQKKGIEVEAAFYAKVHELEAEFQQKFAEVHEQRRKIVAGEYEPTPEEASLPIIHGLSEEEVKELDDKSEPDNGVKGIPEFWLQVLKSAESVGENISDADEEILKFLTDITTTIELSPPGFTLYFHFAGNPFFKNEVLKKKYELMMNPEEEDFFDYDGPSVYKCEGDKIDWYDGKDITKKVIKKKQKKGANAGKFLTKVVKADSFFNFFDPPTVDDNKKNEEDEDEETTDLIRADFELGQILRDHVVPRAVLFYTGEACDDDIFDDFEDDGEDDDEDDDDEDAE